MFFGSVEIIFISLIGLVVQFAVIYFAVRLALGGAAEQARRRTVDAQVLERLDLIASGLEYDRRQREGQSQPPS